MTKGICKKKIQVSCCEIYVRKTWKVKILSLALVHKKGKIHHVFSNEITVGHNMDSVGAQEKELMLSRPAS